MQVNIIIANRDFVKVAFKSKMVNLDSSCTIKSPLVQGNLYRRTHLVTRSTCKTRLVTHSSCLNTRSTCSTVLEVLVSPHVVLVFLLVRLVFQSACPLAVLICSLVVPVCPMVVFVCPLIVKKVFSLAMMFFNFLNIRIL